VNVELKAGRSRKRRKKKEKKREVAVKKDWKPALLCLWGSEVLQFDNT
jgi:hypothetical protein